MNIQRKPSSSQLPLKRHLRRVPRAPPLAVRLPPLIKRSKVPPVRRLERLDNCIIADPDREREVEDPECRMQRAEHARTGRLGRDVAKADRLDDDDGEVEAVDEVEVHDE